MLAESDISEQENTSNERSDGPTRRKRICSAGKAFGVTMMDWRMGKRESGLSCKVRSWRSHVDDMEKSSSGEYLRWKCWMRGA